ncbi:FecR family protein [Chitinophaga solisilvae]|uniref:FecR family protein n=1 Tax=Chitinophaga solisilvae TaxID=1233460 RepID=UPI001369FF94|nr:FecR family protein [Chitinophaga solisilvae]
MNQLFNTPEDLLQDDSFLQYCMGTDEEAIAAWEGWLAAHPEQHDLVASAKEIFEVINGQQGQLNAAVSQFRQLLQERATEKPVRNIRWWQAAAAAVLMLTAGTAVRFYTRPPQKVAQQVPSDILPGHTKAVLTLGDGATVTLDTSGRSNHQEKDGTLIHEDNGRLVYGAAGKNQEKIVFNTLTTPRGGEYQVVLPDGSKVWLNAATSLRFPTRFAGNERTVYLKGEAYFEITPDDRQPFHVALDNGLKISVLGTAFNVMNYADETTINTTLVSGKVKVTPPAGNAVLLAPSQQAVLAGNNQQLTVSEADTDKVTAWKTGMFEFEDDDLPAIMRQLARWYDVEVAYTGRIPDMHYSGSIRKQSTLSQALRILKTAGIRYTVQDRKIIITANQSE